MITWTRFRLAVLVVTTTAGLATTSGATLAAPTPQTNSPDSAPVTIGLLLPPEETGHDEIRRAAELALERCNRTSAVPARLIIRGRPGQWGDDADEAGRLVMDDQVRILVAPPAGVASHLVLQVAGRTRTPVVTLSPDSSVVGAGIPWMVRMVPSTRDEALALLPLAVDWHALVPKDRPGREIGSDLRAAAGVAGVNLRITGIGDGQPDADVVQRLLDPMPRGILIWLPPAEAARYAIALRARGYTGVLAGPRLLRGEEFPRAAGPAATDFHVADLEIDDATEVAMRDFVRAYEVRGLVPPGPLAWSTADAVALAIGLARLAGDGPIHRLFPLAKEGTGLTGAWEFDRQGNRRARLEILRRTTTAWTRAVAPHSPPPPSPPAPTPLPKL